MAAARAAQQSGFDPRRQLSLQAGRLGSPRRASDLPPFEHAGQSWAGGGPADDLQPVRGPGPSQGGTGATLHAR